MVAGFVNSVVAGFIKTRWMFLHEQRRISQKTRG